MEYILGYSINSEVLLGFGITLMKTIVFLTIAIFIQVLIKRGMLIFRQYQRKKFLDLWRPILAESIAIVPDQFPILNKQFIFDFISEWNSLYDKLGGISHENLINVAQKLEINKYATEMLISSHTKIRLTGIITLGNMHAKAVWPYLSSIAQSSDTILSMAAYRALAQIDMDKALEEVLPKLIKRMDWPASMVAKILKDTKSPKVCELLADASMTAKEAELPNIIRYINVLKCSNSTLVFRHVLAKKIDDQIISLCLQEMQDPSAIDLVHRYLDYPRWHVRVHAASALGKIGSKDDLIHLKKLLHDRQWWVRYRAAQAIVKMPFIDQDELASLRNDLNDERAKQILEQAIAEKELL